jgi:hypothetical protein
MKKSALCEQCRRSIHCKMGNIEINSCSLISGIRTEFISECDHFKKLFFRRKMRKRKNV